MPVAQPLHASPPEQLPALFSCVLDHTGRAAAWIRLSGELDLATAPQLATRLEEALAGARLVVVDLRQLTFMDSAGLAVVVAAHNRARRSERRLVLIRGPRQVDRLLELTGLADRLEITDLNSVQAAQTRSELAVPPAESLETSELWPRRHTPGARDELVRRFLPLARQLASRYRNPNEPLEDLVQVATLGLLSAIDRFDPDRGVAFRFFAIPTILGELKRHFRQIGWAAHVPRGAKEMALRVDHATRELTAGTGRAPNVQALAAHLHAPVGDVLLGLEAGSAHYSTSLDAPAPGADFDDPYTLAESLASDEDRIGLVEAALSFKAAMTQLPHRERQALTLRIGQNMKQAEIADRMNCSQMQISRLLRRATTRLRALTDPDLAPL